MKFSKQQFGLQKIGNTDLETIELLEKGAFVKQVASGSFVYMHLMQNIINNVSNLVRKQLHRADAMEIGLLQLQSADLWKATGRYHDYGEEMYRMKDRKGRDNVLVGTSEELVTHVAANHILSYKDLNFTWFQINNKFRDEIRTHGGLLRAKEFIMMDAYSFHDSKAGLESEYANMRQAIISILTELGLDYRIEVADSGEIGGAVSEEFLVNDVEVAHIFQLDDKYSKALDGTYVDAENISHNFLMGCYGIGITRLIQVIADTKRVGNFLNWGKIASYEYGIVVANGADTTQVEAATRLYTRLKDAGKMVYLDDRLGIRLGEKLHEIDRIGTFNKIIVGKKAGEELCELKEDGKWTEKSFDDMN